MTKGVPVAQDKGQRLRFSSREQAGKGAMVMVMGDASVLVEEDDRDWGVEMVNRRRTR